MPQSVRASVSRNSADGWLMRIDDGRGVRRLDRLDLEAVAAVEIGQAAPFGLRVEIAVPAPQHLGRGQRRAVVEGDALAQAEGVGLAVGRDLDASRRAAAPTVPFSR